MYMDKKFLSNSSDSGDIISSLKHLHAHVWYYPNPRIYHNADLVNLVLLIMVVMVMSNIFSIFHNHFNIFSAMFYINYLN